MDTEEKTRVYKFERQKGEVIKLQTDMQISLSMNKEKKAYLTNYYNFIMKFIEQFNAMNTEEETGIKEIEIKQ